MEKIVILSALVLTQQISASEKKCIDIKKANIIIDFYQKKVFELENENKKLNKYIDYLIRYNINKKDIFK